MKNIRFGIVAILGLAIAVFTIAHSQADVSPWAFFATRVDHSCAISKAGKTYCWGQGSSGQLGNGTDKPASVPTLVKTDQTFVTVGMGWVHTCALNTVGKAYCWGFNDRSQLGADRADYNIMTPIAVKTDLNLHSTRRWL